MALSRALQVLLMDGVMPISMSLSEKESAVYRTPGPDGGPARGRASSLRSESRPSDIRRGLLRRPKHLPGRGSRTAASWRRPAPSGLPRPGPRCPRPPAHLQHPLVHAAHRSLPYPFEFVAALLDVGRPGLGEAGHLPALSLLDGDQALVLKVLQGRVDRARAGPPEAPGTLADLLDHLVAVHRPL